MNPFKESSDAKSSVAPGNPPENIGGTDSNNPPVNFATPEGIQTTPPDIYYPEHKGFEPESYVPVGGVILKSDPIEYNTGRYTAKITVRNTGDRPIQVGSHFHFFEVNRYLEFDRPLCFGCHLNIPATTAIRFEPGEEKEVEVVAYSGKRVAIGFNNLTNGYTGGEDYPGYYPIRTRSIARMKEYGFKSESQEDADAEYTENEKQQ